jgi:hypothetical protein
LQESEIGMDESKGYYFAEATALTANLLLPLKRDIEPQAFAQLPAEGGYKAQQVQAFKLQSVLSYDAAHTQVAGNRETKPGRGYTTLVTAVVEGLNILDVLTADLVVAQISTEHPLHGCVPSITFLGTRFENLRIAGHKVELGMCLDIFGKKPKNDAPYTHDAGFMKRVSQQHARVRAQESGHDNPVAELLQRFNAVPESFETSTAAEEGTELSLVDKAEGEYPGQTSGHILHVPHFGTIHLAKLSLKHTDFKPGTRIPTKTHAELTMIDADMGCIGQGRVQAASAKTNGAPTG